MIRPNPMTIAINTDRNDMGTSCHAMNWTQGRENRTSICDRIVTTSKDRGARVTEGCSSDGSRSFLLPRPGASDACGSHAGISRIKRKYNYANEISKFTEQNRRTQALT